MRFAHATVCLPTDDRARAYAFYAALGFETPGELAEDGVPEPLRIVVADGLQVMLVPTGGFGWVTAGRVTATRGTVECLLSLPVTTPAEVDAVLAAIPDAGGEVASPGRQQPWGYTGTFADPDGHLWEVGTAPA